jgi:hypothetical protein
MRVGRSILALALLASTGGCYYNSNHPNAGAWNDEAVQQPQRVRFFYGYIIDVRPVPVVYASPGFVHWEPQGRELIPIVQQYPAPTPDPPPPGYEDPCPNRVCKGVEYTVMLDRPTTPSDEFLQLGQLPAIIELQNIAQTEVPLPKRTRVAVRMVNNSAAEVMPATSLPESVGGIKIRSLAT